MIDWVKEKMYAIIGFLATLFAMAIYFIGFRNGKIKKENDQLKAKNENDKKVKKEKTNVKKSVRDMSDDELNKWL